MRSIACLVSVLAAAAAVPVQVVPVATSFVHRKDYEQPQLKYLTGALGPQQPGSYYAPVPISQTIDFADRPLPQMIQNAQFIEGDYFEDNGRAKHDTHGAQTEHEQFNTRGERGSTGYKSKKAHAKGKAKKYESHHEEETESNNDREHSKQHNEEEQRGHKNEYENQNGSRKKGQKKHHSKGEEVTGYHKTYSKDEYKKDHDFYDVADKKGHFAKHGNKQGKAKTASGDHKKGKNGEEAYEADNVGKLNAFDKKMISEYESGRENADGHDEDHHEHTDYVSAEKTTNNRNYRFDDDDDEFEDEDEYYDD